MTTEPLLLVGDGIFAGLAFEYFHYDSPYTVKAFVVERKYRTKTEFYGLPVVDLEDVETLYSPKEHLFHAAITYIHLNRVRARLINIMYEKGYCSASYVSGTVRLWPSTKIGRHCFIFENNVIQPSVIIGDNCVLWSCNHIGHHVRIGDNCFISSHVVMAGFSEIGDFSFIGINSAIIENVRVGADCLVGAGSLVSKNLADNIVTKPATIQKILGARSLMEVDQ
ncbi:MAG: acetyltransferase [Rickettsiales bacterium]|jgi:sugar O-acyltransferase (sialic acid O-acetyltransferase NeuD family)|nr:acetyltransferase [Rickettsiales bacterium]